MIAKDSVGTAALVTDGCCDMGLGGRAPGHFLASWRAGAVNGVILHVDGGAAATTPSTK